MQISTAVAFLKLPQVQSSPLKGKQEFLLSKGLTDEEVRISCEIAGVLDQSATSHLNVSPCTELCCYCLSQTLANILQSKLALAYNFQEVFPSSHSINVKCF